MSDINRQIHMSRSELNAVVLQEKYEFKTAQSDNVLKDAKNYLKKNYKPSPDCMKRYVYKRIPFIKWIQTYDFKSLFLNDLIGGLTVGVFNIPQGMAYSQTAGLTPIYGLYVSFFTSLVYMFLGTSRNVSIGTYGIVSLMVGTVTQTYSGVLYPATTALGPNDTIPSGFISSDPNQGRVMVATVLSFLTGAIHIVLAIIHAGVASKYLSDVVVAAFTTGAAYHVVTSQINTLLGIKLPQDNSIFTLIANYVDIFKNIGQTNIAALVISIVTMLCLYLVKHFFNNRYQHKLIAPIPIELAVVIFGTLFSYLFDFNGRWKVPIVGKIPLGFPIPSVPPLFLFSKLISDSISIAIVSFAINLSMAKLYAKKYNYRLHPNQELLAFGVGNVLGSFFSCFPSCVGISRTVVLVGTNSKTQLHSIFSNIILAIVITAIGFLFKTLPNCCLASIIAVALLKMLFEVRQIVPIYKRSKLETLAWLATFAGVIILDIDYGLYIGLGVSILLVIIQSQRATTIVLGNIPHTDIYEDIKVTKNAREIEGIKIIRYEASLYYANVENFTYKVQKLTGIKPDDILESIKKLEMQHAKKIDKIKSQKAKDEKKKKKMGVHVVSPEEPNRFQLEEEQCNQALKAAIGSLYASISIKDVIIDCSSMNQVDSMGIDSLIKLNSLFKELGITLRLTHCRSSLFRIFEKLGFKQKFDYCFVYPTIHDAVIYAFKERNSAETMLTSYEGPARIEAQTEADRRVSIEKQSIQMDSTINLDGVKPVYVDSEKNEYNALREIADDILNI